MQDKAENERKIFKKIIRIEHKDSIFNENGKNSLMLPELNLENLK